MATSDIPAHHWIKGGGYWANRWRLHYARWQFQFFATQQTASNGNNSNRKKRGRHAPNKCGNF